jgi:hypothetical protein
MKRPARLAALGAACAALTAAGCSKSDATRIDVTVTVDPALGLDNVAIDLQGGQRQALDLTFPVSASGTPPAVPPIVWEVAVSNPSAPFDATVTAQGMKTGTTGAIVTQVGVAHVVSGAHVEVMLMLSEACKGMSCTAGQTCQAGACGVIPVFGQPGGGGQGGAGGSSHPDASTQPDGAVDGPRDQSAADGQGGGATDAHADTGVDTGPTKSPIGNHCSVDTDCDSNHCAQGVCCKTACTDSCSACTSALTGSTADGTCAFVSSGLADPANACPAAAMPSSCGNTGHCDGKGACEKYGSNTICQPASCGTAGFTSASTCNGMGGCTAGTTTGCKGFSCSTTSGCATSCSVDTDCPGGYCTSGKTCAATMPDGSGCTANDQCTHANCVSGVCCGTACGGTCMTCATGVCKPVVAGGSSNSACTKSSATCGLDGTCDGNGGCRNAVSTTSCRTAACSGGTETFAATCDGAGSCPPAVTQGCGQYACNTSACFTSCTSKSQCVAAATCVSSACVACTQTICGSTCTNLASDGANCGACGHSCQGGGCSGGTCTPIALATFTAGRQAVALAINSSNVFIEIPGGNSAWSLYSVPKNAANIAPSPILTLSQSNNLGGYLAASDTLLVTQYGFNNPGGSTLTTFSCTPTNCATTMQTWFTDSQAPMVCDMAAQECFPALPSQGSIQHSTFGTPSQTKPADFGVLISSNDNSAQWASGGFLYLGSNFGTGTLPSILTRMAEDGSGRTATLANFGAGNGFTVVNVTSTQVYLVGTLDSLTTTGMLSVPLPNGLTGAPPYLAGTTLTGNGWIAGWGDDAGIYFGTMAAQWVTCPASGCTGPPKVVGDATQSAPLLIGDAQSVYWIDSTATGVSLKKLPR